LFRQRSQNAIGNGDWSDDISIGLINLPIAPSAPLKIVKTSTKNSASLTWSLLSDSTAPAGLITGYRLY
jgi:hypothetical protein